MVYITQVQGGGVANLGVYCRTLLRAGYSIQRRQQRYVTVYSVYRCIPTDLLLGPTRLKGYIYVRHRNIDRLHNTHSYYSRAASSAATPTTTITSPRITLVIVIPRSPPAVQKASHDSSIPALMKRYYRSSNQLFSDRLCRNPVWILLDLLSLMGNSAGEAWMSNIENILDWVCISRKNPQQHIG